MIKRSIVQSMKDWFPGLTKSTCEVLISLIKTLIFVVLSLFLLTVSTGLIQKGFNSSSYLQIIDGYLKLILSSWPASFLIIGTLLLFKQHNAIDAFIRRMTKIGPDGATATAPTPEQASVGELKVKSVEDAKEVEEVAIEGEKSTPITVDSQAKRYHLTEEEQQKRLKLIVTVEELVQTQLISKYGDRYKPQVKFDYKDKPVVVDGVLVSKNLTSLKAFEIKYLSSKTSFDALRYILSKFKAKLIRVGIDKLIAIIVSSDISVDEAVRMQDQCVTIARLYFYNFKDDKLVPVLIPDRKETLF